LIGWLPALLVFESMPPFSPEIKHEIWKEQSGKCEICGDKAESVHHQVPESYDGKSIKANGLLVCAIDHAVLDHLALDYGITPLGSLNELPDEFFRHGNPFKEIIQKDFITLKRDDFTRIVGRHKKHRR